MILDTEIALLDANRNTLKFKTTAKLKDKRTAIANTRETREGWPLLTVETEVNGDSKSTDERGPSLVGGSLGSVVPEQETFILPWLLWSA